MILLLMADNVGALTGAPDPKRHPHRTPMAAVDYVGMFRTHRIGNIGLALTNWGQFGSWRRWDCCDYCTGLPAESFEFPFGSGIDYLALGGLWVGAIKGRDTLVSIGTDVWWWGAGEFFPKPWPDGMMIERTNRPVLRAPRGSRCPDIYFSEDAVSEQDFITRYYDTVTNSQIVGQDPYDSRPHTPLGVEITQRSYAWSFDYARDFILMDLSLRNLSDETLSRLYMGLYMDQDVGHIADPDDLAWDDVSGYIHEAPSASIPGLMDTLSIAWTADNDGDPASGRYDYGSPTGVAGIRVVRAPTANPRLSFNWWVTNPNPARDWGPNRRDTDVRFARGNLGTPLGDVERYQVLANGELDWDQLESAVDHQAQGWLPPARDPSLAFDLANGSDTRYVLGVGPFDVLPESTLTVTIAFVAGADLHTDTRNYYRFFDPMEPHLYREQLDFSNLVRNARWAGWVYDTPGFDTDGDGNRGRFRMVDGDTLYYAGDGVPDFQGPPPPPAPKLRFETSYGQIMLRWNGEKSETAKDPFSHEHDFEGYRVYMSRTGHLEDFALLTQRDRVDFVRYRYRPSLDRWEATDRPFTLDSLESLYTHIVDSVHNFRPFHPDSFKVRDVDEALREIVVNVGDPSKLDTSYYCFERFDANTKVDDTALAIQVSCCGEDVRGVIRKRFPFATRADTVHEQGTAYPAYYEYEYVIDGLQIAEPVYLSVTAFDYGDPSAGISSLESSPQANAEVIWPINSAQVVAATRPKPSVYPNPYRLADAYNAAGWEDPQRAGLDPERARRVTFVDVPDTCTISIWSLDGDLVRRMQHAEPSGSAQATVAVWNLITRNTQAVKTGIYIWSIESRFGTDIGKLVVIK